ncbi:short-chain dehydrogenase [Salipaludibacillus keqinensis]|uniref:Short-chain dehydrogenase n=1 Tax=Salipaludibacillus keqinensis TaxID=2045207 RepID=A0A323TGQ7_9BACI|nr:SDR family NAD(P)-dependent oxidoreductase [Salipaludibacillus keqinensis]PYZ93456.1 short-chain dehydrogenase [Salipaludibacillus keqinensis]
MNVFVTGGTGFLGMDLVNRLVEEGHDVYVLVRSQKKADQLFNRLSQKEQEQVHIIEGDLGKEKLGLSVVNMKELTGTIDAVYHSAAYLSFDPNDRDALFEINVQGTKNLLALAEQMQVSKFIHVSTAYTLGDRKEGFEQLYPLDSNFVNAYEESKCHAEHAVMSYQDRFDVHIMRPAIIIGDSETGEADTNFGMYGVMRAVELLKKKMARSRDSLSDKKMKILVGLEDTTHIVPVDYITKLLVAGLTRAKKNHVYNLVNPSPPDNHLIMEAIKEGMDFQAIELIPYEDYSTLSLEELKLNEPLQVFKPYLNRTIYFHDDNTRDLLAKANEPSLEMDRPMLLRIVRGFRDRRKTLIKQ